MDKKEIAAVWQAFLEVQEGKGKKKEALDPVGKEDGDIDNDGDKDSSDEYLAKRRKAIGKAMDKDDKKDKEQKEGKIPPQFMKGKDKKDDDKEDDSEKSDDKEEKGKKPEKGVNPFAKKKDDKKDKEEVEEGCGKKHMKEGEKKECPKCEGEGCDHCDGKGYHEVEKETYGKKMKESALFSDEELAAIEEKMKQPGDTGTAPEGIMDKESPKSKKFADDHKKSDAKFETMQAKGTEDASKAGKASKQASARRGDNLGSGDKMQKVSK